MLGAQPRIALKYNVQGLQSLSSPIPEFTVKYW